MKILLLSTLLLSLTLTACGGGGGDDSSGSSTSGSATDGGETDGGETDGGETDGGETDGGETDGGETDGGETDGGETDGGETDGGETDGGETDGGETDGGETDGGETDGGETDGGETDGGETDGGETDGGETDGGETDGGETDGGETDGGETDGGETDGGETDGGETDGGETDGGETGGGETGGGSTPTIGDNTVPAISCDEVYASDSALEDAQSESLAAGTTLCLGDGVFDGLELQFGGIGTAESPITIAAENPGMAIITGESSVRMSGEYVVLQGLVFRDGMSASSDFLQTRGGGSLHCNNCRIVENAIIDMNVGSEEGGRWLKIYGENNRVDHNWFSGKTTPTVLLEVVREDDPANRAINTLIDYNYFGDRPPADGKAYAESGDNEFEAIRVGFSGTNGLESFTTIEYNYFERIDAEAEVISNKSSSSTIRYNTIRDSYGSLTTRHGANALIDSNFIIGDGHPFSGGIRVVDSGHIITNNYIEGSRYIDTPWQGGIVLTRGDNSSGTDNGYQNIENILVAHNTIVDSVNSLNVAGGSDSRVSVLPVDVYLVNNIISNAVGPVIVNASNELPAGDSSVAGNTFYGQSFSDNSAFTSATGISFEPVNLTPDTLGISRPVDATNLDAVTDANIADFALPTKDFDGQIREGATQRGADHISDTQAMNGLLNSADVGPLSYRPTPGRQFVERITLSNSDFDEGSSDWTLVDANITTNIEDTFSRQSGVEITDASGEVNREINLEANSRYTLSAFTKGAISLGARIGNETVLTNNTTSDYRFTQVSFESGDATSATIFAQPAQTVTLFAPVADGDFLEFRANSGNNDNWTTIEDTPEDINIGDVGSSSDSASGAEGSARFRYRVPEHANGSPGMLQSVDGVLENTDYTFSVYLKRDSDAEVLVDIDLSSEDTIIAENLIVDYSDLDETTEADDSFRRFDYVFNSGTNTSIDISIRMIGQEIDLGGATAQVDDNGFYTDETQRLNEIRIDDVSLTYQSQATGNTEVFVDSFRVIRQNVE